MNELWVGGAVLVGAVLGYWQGYWQGYSRCNNVMHDHMAALNAATEGGLTKLLKECQDKLDKLARR